MVPAAAAAGAAEEVIAQRHQLDEAHSAAQGALAAELEVARQQRAAADDRALQLEAQVPLGCKLQGFISGLMSFETKGQNSFIGT